MRTLFIIWALLISLCGSSTYADSLQTQKLTLYPYKNIVELQDDFVSGATGSGNVGWMNWATASGTGTPISSEANRSGIYRKTTGAVANTISQLRLSFTSSIISTTFSWDQVWIIRPVDIDADTIYRTGMTNNWGLASIQHGVYFERLGTDTNWFCVTHNNTGSPNRTDSGVAAIADWVTHRIVFTAGAALPALFYINGVLVCSQDNSRIPASLILPGTHVINTAAASKTLDHDYWQLRILGLVR